MVERLGMGMLLIGVAIALACVFLAFGSAAFGDGIASPSGPLGKVAIIAIGVAFVGAGTVYLNSFLKGEL